LPRISFDHVGVIPFCKPHFPPELALQGKRDAWGYRRLMGQPDRVLISSFYPAEPLNPGTRVVGPILRPEVRKASPRQGDFLLAYFNRGQLQFTEAVESELLELEVPMVIYGTTKRGQFGHLKYREIDPLRFVEDFAHCRAVVATAGNQLIGEALHLRKPVMALPENVFEQQLNAWIVQRMGIGHRGSFAGLTADQIELFLTDVPACTARMEEYAGDGSADAIAALRQFIEELAPSAGCAVPSPCPRH
jgi:uncharacterized protein (TIGR00661 family)